MISLLHGTLYRKLDGEIIMVTGGVGYRVFMAPDDFASCEVGSDLTVHTYLNVREDALQLFGFLSPERLHFFETLIKVSGIGPKMALPATSSISFDSFKKAIVHEDTDVLRELPGVGKKVAQKMVLELKDGIAKESTETPEIEVSGGEVFTEAKEALEGLGFAYNEIDKHLREAVSQMGSSASIDALVKFVLKEVGKREE